MDCPEKNWIEFYIQPRERTKESSWTSGEVQTLEARFYWTVLNQLAETH